jgi:hypothetical protein
VTFSNGNYVVISPNWDNGSVVDVGAVTWGSGIRGITGSVHDAPSIIGEVTSSSDTFTWPLFDPVNDYIVVGIPNEQRVAFMQAPAFTSAVPPAGTYGSAYTHSFTTRAGPVPTYSITAGKLPLGLNLDSATGTLSGTPTQIGDFTFTVNASNGITPDANQEMTLVINKALLAVSAIAQNKVYGAALPTLTFTTVGLANGDTAATALTGGLATNATISSNVGTYAITQGTLSAANYNINFQAATLNVTRAPLTIAADNQTMTVGSALPTFTLTYSGLVNGDTPNTAFSTPPTVSTIATSASEVGTYTISISGGVSANYTITAVNGTLTVQPVATVVNNQIFLPIVHAPPPQ